jgi:hypothetical protein
VELDHGINSGLWMNSLAPGLVSIYEEQSSRIERDISLEKWAEMSVDEKAMIVAVRRTTIAMKNIQSEAEIKDSERKARK